MDLPGEREDKVCGLARDILICVFKTGKFDVSTGATYYLANDVVVMKAFDCADKFFEEADRRKTIEEVRMVNIPKDWKVVENGEEDQTTRTQRIFEYCLEHEEGRIKALFTTVFNLNWELSHKSLFSDMKETPEKQAKILRKEFSMLVNIILDELAVCIKEKPSSGGSYAEKVGF